MRIAMIAPPWYSVPPSAYGGVEMLVAALTDGLVARGHEVLVVSAGRNGTSGTGRTTLTEPADDRLGDEVTSLLHAAMAEDAISEFRPDVVHDHTLPGLLAAPHRSCATVATVHGPPRGDYGALLRAARHVRLVAISQAQRRSSPELPWHATVHNGIPVRSYPFRVRKDDYLLFLGRMHPDKGVVEAIEVAERSGSNLLIAARVHGSQEEQFFAEAVRPRLTSRIEFLGELGFVEKTRLLSRARALLFPLQWDEPYGLVVAEAQACGTPVLSLRRGAIPELVVEGTTGWLRDHHLQLVDLVPRLAELDPHACRTHALETLDIGPCVRGYEEVFSRAAQAGPPRPARRLFAVAPARPGAYERPAPVRTPGTTDTSARVTQMITKETS